MAEPNAPLNPDPAQRTPDDAAVLGRGWAAPAHLDALGEAAQASGPEKVRQSVLLILGTRRGERVMRPDFGAGLEDLLFEPVTAATAAVVRLRVEQGLIAWEPRIDVLGVEVSVTDRAAGRLDVSIDYRIRATNTFYNLVYPFYLHEGAAR
ncbi:GPW/gp25 family protein [Embleya sp. MST-111070]|uniref:GPW/gp25 family protein n=1 Tax=Embleya sp. MST-111070 TaxID=3398231 RepID=UPI003F73B160